MNAASSTLIADLGNSRLKLAWFEGERCSGMRVVSRPVEGTALQEAIGALLPTTTPAVIGIGSVSDEARSIAALFGDRAPVVLLTGDMPAPIAVRYGTPGSLGVDRLANAVGAAALFPHRAALAVDVGTCITADLVLPGEGYVGGLISPGPWMRARAMNAYSARLPLVMPEEAPPLLGTDTHSSLAAGVFHGVRFELEGLIATLRAQWPGLAVVLTGGGAPPWAAALKSGIFADPSLTLRGLHALLLHHIASRGLPVAGTVAAGPVGPGPAGG